MNRTEIKDSLIKMKRVELNILASEKLGVKNANRKKNKATLVRHIIENFSVEEIKKALEPESLSWWKLIPQNYRYTLEWIGIIGSIASIVGLILVFMPIQWNNLITNGEKSNNNFTKLFNSDSTFHILVLPFGQYQKCKIEEQQFHKPLKESLQSIGEERNISIEVETLDTLECSLTYEQAIEIGRNHDADLIIWGDYEYRCSWDTTNLNIKYASISDDLLIQNTDYSQGETGRFSLSTGFDIRRGRFTGQINEVVYYSLGIQALGENEDDKAVEFFSEIPVRDSTSLETIYLILSRQYQAKKQFEKALSCLNKVVNERVVLFDLLIFERGTLYLKMGMINEAITDFESYIEAGGYGFFGYNGLGMAFHKLNSFEEAIKYYDKAIEIFDKSGHAYRNRAESNLGLQNYPNAVSDLNMALELLNEKNHGEIYHQRAKIYEKMNKPFKATADYQKAKALGFIGN